VGILGVMQFYKNGYVDVKVVLIIATAFIAGSYFGSKWALHLPQDTLKKIFAVVMLLISIKMLFIDKKHPETSAGKIQALRSGDDARSTKSPG
jgi:uncharacterized protein